MLFVKTFWRFLSKCSTFRLRPDARDHFREYVRETQNIACGQNTAMNVLDCRNHVPDGGDEPNLRRNPGV